MAADSEFSLEDKTFTVKEDPEGVQKAYDFARNELGAGNVNFSAVKNAE